MFTQSKDNDCGKAVVRKLLAVHNRKRNLCHYELKNECGDFLSIRKELESDGLIYESYRIDDINAIEKDSYPFIAQIIRNDKFHFVIVRKNRKNSFLIYDPQFGNYWIDKIEFLNLFTGNAMLYVNKTQNVRADALNIFDRKSKIFYSIIAVLLLICTMLFFSFLSESKNFVISIITSVLILSLLVLLNGYNFYSCKRFEEKRIIPYVRETKNGDDFRNLENIFKNSLMIVNLYIGAIISLCSIIFILLFSSYFFSFLLVISAIFFILKLALKKTKNYCDFYCSFYEEKFLLNIDKESSIIEYKKARKCAEKYVMINVVVNLCEYLSYAIFSLAIMNIQNAYGMNIFFLCFSIAIMFEKCLSSFVKIHELFDKREVDLNQLTKGATF